MFLTFWLRNVLHATKACTKWSGAEVFCTVWLGNVLRATTACNFSSLIWPAGSAPATLASLLFEPLEPQIIGKNSFLRLFYLFGDLDLLSSETFSSLISSLLLFSSLFFCSTSAFHLSILSEVWLLNFLRIWVHSVEERKRINLYFTFCIFGFCLFEMLFNSTKSREPCILNKQNWQTNLR